MVHSGSNHLPTNGTIAFGEERAPMCYEMANRDGRAMLLVTLHVCILVWLQLVGSQQDNTSTSCHSIDIDTPFGVGYLLGVRFHWWG